MRWQKLILFTCINLFSHSMAIAEDKAPIEESVPIISLEEKYCKTINNSYDCARTIERQQMSELQTKEQSKNLVSRQLKLNLANNQIKIIEESPIKGPFYSFREYFFDLGYLVFHIQYFEGDAYSMISKESAKEFILPGIPIPSPDKKKVLSTSYDLVAGYNPNSIQVWRVSPTDMTREMALEPQPVNWGPSDAIWIDDQTIHFTKNILTEENFPACSVNKMKLVFDGAMWKILEI